ncbi:hypothetical protein NEISUBOT_05514 [Neisseria subflava NJ9703]|uniref:Uncharacterized protein n=1 Tax=Neisseria subflava NJ9703 TaxID=546268 RepID=A0A9W5MY92_NEISU|nr:hypothetical protein NEISUBOT_05514 [Neisseria subflava NJ9703]
MTYEKGRLKPIGFRRPLSYLSLLLDYNKVNRQAETFAKFPKNPLKFPPRHLGDFS